jgi:hypothetical protein
MGKERIEERIENGGCNKVWRYIHAVSHAKSCPRHVPSHLSNIVNVKSQLKDEQLRQGMA